MTAPVLDIRDLSVRFGAVQALADITVSFPAGGRIGLVGPNGAGKTTLLSLISGFAKATYLGGQLLLDGEDLLSVGVVRRVNLGIVRGFQTVRLMDRESVRDNVLLGRERFSKSTMLEQILGLPRARREDAAGQQRLGEVLASLGLSDLDSVKVGTLPFATRRLVEVGRVLCAEPRVMLLDEPMAGLDSRSRVELGNLLVDSHDPSRMTSIIVEHDIEIVRAVCDHIVVLDSGMLIAQGEPDEVFANADVKRAYLGAQS